MAVIRDIMPAFELFQPASVDDALALRPRYGSGAWVMAGGLDSFDWLKDRIKRPEVVIDLSQIKELRGVRETADGIEIGAMTTLTEVVRHPLVQAEIQHSAEAAEAAASPQIRNQGTIGGNVSQDARCWYYRSGWPCYRAGGNICYADTPTAINREHAIFGADRCVAVNPSDTAPALIALDAKMVIRTPSKGDKVVNAEDYFIGPGIDITKHDDSQARRSADGDSHSIYLGWFRFLFRKGSRPRLLGFRPGERRGSQGDVGQSIERIRIAVERCGRASRAAHRRGRRGRREALHGRDGGDGRADRHSGRAAVAIQRLQGAADAQPGEARYSRRAAAGLSNTAILAVGLNALPLPWFRIRSASEESLCSQASIAPSPASLGS